MLGLLRATGRGRKQNGLLIGQCFLFVFCFVLSMFFVYCTGWSQKAVGEVKCVDRLDMCKKSVRWDAGCRMLDGVCVLALQLKC